MSNSVKNRIASFEAQNQEERLRHSPKRPSSVTRSPRSPVSEHSSFVEILGGGKSKRTTSAARKNESSTNVDKVNTSTISESSTDSRAPSTTKLASQNRIDRLKRANHAVASSASKETLSANQYAKASSFATRSATLRAPQPHDSPLPDPSSRGEPRRSEPIETNESSTATAAHPRGASRVTATAKRHRAMAKKSATLKKALGMGLATSESSSSSHNETATSEQHPSLDIGIIQPDLESLDSDPDKPLAPRYDANAALLAQAPRKSRFDKIQKIQNSRRKQHFASSTTNPHSDGDVGTSSSPTRNRNQVVMMPVKRNTSSSASSPRRTDESISQTQQSSPGSEGAPDDETLTSVRQIVDPPAQSDSLAEENDRLLPHLWMTDTSISTNNQHNDYVKRLSPTSSSSEFEDEDNHYGSVMMEDPTKSGLSGLTPEVGTFFNSRKAQQPPPPLPRPSTSSYANRHQMRSQDDVFGDEDDDFDDETSGTSLYYEQRRRKKQQQMEQENEARKKAVAAAQAELDRGPLLQQEDVEHYRKSLETPTARTAIVVATAATVGCVLMGPVGLVVGLSVGALGVGAMQIPAEQREHMLKSAQEKCAEASDAIANTCVHTYKDSGISDHVPTDVVENCCTGIDGEKDTMSVLSEPQEEKKNDDPNPAPAAPSRGPSVGPVAVESSVSNRLPPSPTNRMRNQKKGRVVCLRDGPIIPVEQIHALTPDEQPRAWLDVLASINTTHNEKIEALEEIVILAKDKQRARVLVEEGILDSLLWTVGRFFEKEKVADQPELKWVNKNITKEERESAKLSATCCLTLGKAYCAAIHTEGDLQLMSLYERGTVPEERQLAQMLYEVPHHTRITKLEDPTVVDPRKEVFTMQQIPLEQAEELATAIKALAANAN